MLCEAGYGEDAIILTRSLLNLVINAGYIYRAVDPNECALDYNATGWVERRKLLKQSPKHADWGKDVDWAAQENRAKRWNDVRIKDKAELVGLGDTYCELYRFGSSYEHSDSGSLGSYWGPSTDTGQQISTHPSDDLIEITLGYTFKAMALLAEIVAATFQLDAGDGLRVLRGTFAQLGANKVKAT